LVCRKEKKDMAKKLLSVWLSVTIVLFSTITIFAEENVEGQFLNRNIDINGNRLANYYLDDPFFLYQGSAYVPLTEEIGEVLGFSVEMDWESRTLKILKKEPTRAELPEKVLKSNLENVAAVVLQDVTVLTMAEEQKDINVDLVLQGVVLTAADLDIGGQLRQIKEKAETEFIEVPELVVDKLDLEEYPLLQAGEALYLPVRAFTGENCFRWDAFYDDYSGLYISTEAGVDAMAFFDKEESDYNRGLVNYILSKNKSLSTGWATMLVFLFKHEADVNDVDEILLMAMAEKESTFRSDAVGGGSGPVGLMQIMPRTAAGYGIARNELVDPHVNSEFGAKYIGDKIDQYGNNKTVALAAYNQGPLAVSRGTYSTRYATKITGAENSITQYLVKNGYGLGN
jgi:hypothetical protein